MHDECMTTITTPSSRILLYPLCTQDPAEMSLDHYCSNNHKQLTINCPYVLYYTQQYKHVSYTFTSCDFFVDHVILTIERS